MGTSLQIQVDQVYIYVNSKAFRMRNSVMAVWLRVLFLVLILTPGFAFADPAPFDLAGPLLEVDVARAGKTLPIAAVPNLAVGDKVSIKAHLPPGQSVHYLLVAAFLRGATNPPPENWFYSSETWNPRDNEGLEITVPRGAQQVLVFLAPETGGDFKTIIGAVRGQPGAFVRASQDLNQATLDRARLKVYLAAIRKISQSNPDSLKTASTLLSRSLLIKFDSDCLQKIPELQAPCLMQGQDSLIMNDGHSTSIVEGMTSGYALDLAQQISDTPQAGFGYYSPYVAAIADIARIMDSFHTAQYRYIPALANEQDDQLALELNTPPSFHNPKSVLVAALPAVQPPQMPPLRPVNPKQVYCAEQTELVLPTEGAPLVFATGYAHGMVLHLKGKNGKFVDLPVRADAEKGGFVANTAGLSPSNFGDVLDGSLSGYWGFETYDGPEFHLENTHPQHWQIVDQDQNFAIAGQDTVLQLATENAACVDSILLEKPTGDTIKEEWKPVGPNQVTITVSLKKVKPGPLKLLVKQYGSKDPDTIPFQAYAPAGHLDSFVFHAGDDSGVLKGSMLGDVESLSLNGVSFKPGHITDAEDAEELSLTASNAKAAEALKEGDASTAKVALKDGRVLSLDMTVAAPRPTVTLIGTSIQPAASSVPSSLQLTAPDELPQGAVLTFSVHAQVPAVFSGDEKIEISTVHGTNLATLTLASGLTLEDSEVALATLDTSKAFATSASGPFRFRVVEDGVAGNWQPLATLVRLPKLHELKCPEIPGQPCQLFGSQLFLVDSIANDAQFSHAIQVPAGFPGYVLSVPRPVEGQLFVKLRDDPAIVNMAVFPDSVSPPTAAALSGGAPAASQPATPTASAGAQLSSTPPQTSVPAAQQPVQPLQVSPKQPATMVARPQSSGPSSVQKAPSVQTVPAAPAPQARSAASSPSAP
jgi:hypothetical protein